MDRPDEEEIFDATLREQEEGWRAADWAHILREWLYGKREWNATESVGRPIGITTSCAGVGPVLVQAKAPLFKSLQQASALVLCLVLCLVSLYILGIGTFYLSK